MKKILLILLSFFLFVGTSYAAMQGIEIRAKELIVADSQDELYSRVDILNIYDNEDLASLDKVDFTKLKQLQIINIKNVFFKDFDKLKTEYSDKQVDLYLINSVIDLKNADLSKYNSIYPAKSYVINSQDSNNIEYLATINADDLIIDPKYKDKVEEAAQEIYEKSDKTPEGIIKEVTIYVINNLEYYLRESGSDEAAFFELHKGVCADYAHMTSVLLNKLGIFSLNISGQVIESNMETNHAWVVIYLNGKWYSHDPTWLDHEGAEDIIRNNAQDELDIMKYYFRPIDDEVFNQVHFSDFNNYDLIPVEERVSKSSLIKDKYIFLDGTKQNFKEGENNNLSFRTDMNYNMFNKSGKVFVDNNLVDPKNYVLSKGSTIVELKKDFLDSLKEGKHIVKLSLYDKETETEFTIEKINRESIKEEEKTEEVKNPNTSSFLSKILIITFIISAVIYFYSANSIVNVREKWFGK